VNWEPRVLLIDAYVEWRAGGRGGEAEGWEK